MTKEVMVTIAGIQTAETTEEEPIELVCPGECYEKNGTYYILYEEVLEGTLRPIKNVLKIKEKSLEVQKRGPVTAKMLFEEGKSRTSTYSIPYGSFLVETKTTCVQVLEEDGKMKASAIYVLKVNGEHCADCRIQILVEPRASFRL